MYQLLFWAVDRIVKEPNCVSFGILFSSNYLKDWSWELSDIVDIKHLAQCQAPSNSSINVIIIAIIISGSGIIIIFNW